MISKNSIGLNKDKKYSGLSLIEMLITLVIISIILVVTSSTLIALIKASAISSARALSRDESEFILELLEREIKNADADDVVIYDVPTEPNGARYIDFTNSTVRGNLPGGITPILTPGVKGNEIHIRSSKNPLKWICMAHITGYKDDVTVGVIARRETESSGSPGINCLSEAHSDIVFVSSEEVDIELFEVDRYTLNERNTTFIIDLTLKPVYWIPGKQSSIKPEYFRQLVVRTGKLTL